eukprot:CAMPEP_0114134830 /NCGR_PEP_ID=MMETSP0043_2-20121206/14381_1 /TAXON_ID=464988 /ORGANISM="Hemiselmis andersenii, Strain CCMP644" /LENGTH=241 /DNA_ID=CAMNT_0001228525 /DNA_START=27 /DNA_END=748 /DNA_ORIENTATION=-
MLEPLPPIFPVTSAPEPERISVPSFSSCFNPENAGQDENAPTKEGIAAAPEYKGTFYIRSGRPATMVDNALSLVIEPVGDLSSGQFCLRALVPAANSSPSSSLTVLFPTLSDPSPSPHVLHNHNVGEYRLRILQMARILNDSPTREMWASDVEASADFAAAVAVDRPPGAGGGDTRIVEPFESGGSTEVWMSTRRPREQHLVIGKDEDDSLDIRLSLQPVVHGAGVLRLSDAKGDWEERLG